MPDTLDPRAMPVTPDRPDLDDAPDPNRTAEVSNAPELFEAADVPADAPAGAPTGEGPVVLANSAILVLGVLMVASGGLGVGRLEPWIWVAFGGGAVLLCIGWYGLRRRQWVEPIFAASYWVALMCIVAGAVTSLDIYTTTGIQSLMILTVGAAILHRLGAKKVESGR